MVRAEEFQAAGCCCPRTVGSRICIEHLEVILGLLFQPRLFRKRIVFIIAAEYLLEADTDFFCEERDHTAEMMRNDLDVR